jgi:hypothetical protein
MATERTSTESLFMVGLAGILRGIKPRVTTDYSYYTLDADLFQKVLAHHEFQAVPYVYIEKGTIQEWVSKRCGEASFLIFKHPFLDNLYTLRVVNDFRKIQP